MKTLCIRNKVSVLLSPKWLRRKKIPGLVRKFILKITHQVACTQLLYNVLSYTVFINYQSKR